MKSKRFRIVPKAPDVYIVQRKGWLFWKNLGETRMTWGGDTYNHTFEFHSKQTAKETIDTIVRKEAALEAHLSQPIEEYPA